MGVSAGELVELHDAVRAARRAEQYWMEQLARRIMEAKDLEGPIASTFQTLLGTRERSVRAAAHAVARAEERLEWARRSVQEAIDRLRDGERRHEEAKQAHANVLGALEQLANQIRGTTHPAARQLDEIELRLGNVRVEMEGFSNAIAAGSALAAYLGAARSRWVGARVTPSRDPDKYDLRGFDAVGDLEDAAEELPARIRLFEDACAQIGVDMRLGQVHTPGPGMQPAFMLLSLLGRREFAAIAELQRANGLDDQLKRVQEEVSGAVDAMLERMQDFKRDADALDAKRRALLSSLRV